MEMSYIKVAWLHASPDDPVILYSELDHARWEVRKVEVFADGRVGCAGSNSALGGTELGLAPVPPLEEIALDPQFDPQEITREQFEVIWESATGV